MGWIFDTGVKTDIDVWTYNYETKKYAMTYAPQTTTTTTDARSYQLDYVFNPQYIINSPEASMSSKKEGASQAPTVLVMPSQTVSPSQSDSPGLDYGKQESEGGGLDLVTLGAVAVIGIVLFAYMKKKKK